MVDTSNTANPDMQGRFALVATEELAYHGTGDMISDIYWLQGDPEVAALRDPHGADLVSLIVADGGPYCGVDFAQAYPGPGFETSAFQVTDVNCGGDTFAHGHGRDLVVEHDAGNAAEASWAASESAAPPDAPGLFKGPSQPANVSQHGLTATAGELDTEPLARGLKKLSLVLPGDGEIVMLRDDFERRGAGDLVWRGHVEGDDSSQVVLTLKNGFVFGSILYGNAEYEIRAGLDGEHVIEEIDS